MITTDIEAHAQRDPMRTALRYGDNVLSYGQLVREVDKMATRLRAVGVGSSSTVASICENRVETLLLYYAVGKIGATFISINNSLTAPEVAYIMGHAEVGLLLHDEKMQEVALAATLDLPAVRVALFEKLDNVSHLQPRDPRTESVGIFQIAYTSGSTGRPKAVAFDQEAEVAGNQSLIELWAITPADVTVVALPLGFLYGLSTQSSMTLQAGAEVVLMRRFHPKEVLDAFVSHKASVFHGVPTMFAMMLEFAEQNSLHIDLSFMRLLVSAGAPLSRELRGRFEARFKKTIDDYYALTEVRPVFGKFANDSSSVPNGAIGKAAPGVVIKIADDSGNEVAPGETGELWVRAPSTARGYYKDTALTQTTFINGLMRTGDRGYRDIQGFYYLTGRIKDIIIRGGANIDPVEVEETIQSHPEVGMSAVIGVPNEKLGQLPVAYVMPKDANHVSGLELIAYCKAKLADFKVPSEIVWLPQLPLGITGKVDKNVLLASWIQEQTERS